LGVLFEVVNQMWVEFLVAVADALGHADLFRLELEHFESVMFELFKQPALTIRLAVDAHEGVEDGQHESNQYSTEKQDLQSFPHQFHIVFLEFLYFIHNVVIGVHVVRKDWSFFGEVTLKT